MKLCHGLYLRGAIQNSGVTRGNNGDVRIYGNNNALIYPREQKAGYSNVSMGGMSCYFIGEFYGNSWQTPACQGYYYASNGRGGRRIGLIQWNNGKPNIPRKNQKCK